MTYFPLTFFGAWYCWELLNHKRFWRWSHSVAVLALGTIITVSLITVVFLMKEKDRWIERVTDHIIKGQLEFPVQWSGFEIAGPVIFLLFLVIAVVMFHRKNAASGVINVYVGSLLFVLFLTYQVTPKVERHIQGGPINFYKSKAGDDCYVEALFKTYADLFYTKKPKPDNPKSLSREWLLTGPIDKPVFFVARSKKKDRLVEKYGLEVINDAYGYVYLKRDPPRLDSLSNALH